jgi:hypothetical protein
MPDWIGYAIAGAIVLGCVAVCYAACVVAGEADDRDELLLQSDWMLSDGDRVRDRTERRRLAYKAWSQSEAERIAECRAKFESEAG